MSDTIDLGSGDAPWELAIVLPCKRCGKTGSPMRRRDDPKTVVRCGACGKRHSTEALAVQ